jgi:SnoaL-like protein
VSLEDRVKEYYTLFGERKLKELEALFTDDSLIIDYHGVEHHSSGVVRMFELFPPAAKFALLSAVSDGKSVLAAFRVEGGPPGRAALGRDLFVFYGDKIRVLETSLPPA